MIGKIISHYKILERLGEGGMGVVYKAKDTKLDRLVAIKFLPPTALGTEEEKARFRYEALAAAALNHPNICTIYEFDEFQSHNFIVMEFVDGQNLKEKIASGPLSFEEIVNIVFQIAKGLYEAHEKGIIHRDIKSANIMLTKKEQVKIMDFGLAKLPEKTEMTKNGTTMGTVSYMSPEQVKGESVDQRSDIWSAGVIAYEMITGELPFKGEIDQAVIYSILNEDSKEITEIRSGIPDDLVQLIYKTLSKDPKKRYQDVIQILDELKELQTQFTGVTSDILPYKRGFKKRLKLLYLSIIVIIIISIIGLWLFYPSGAIPFNERDWILIVDTENQTGDEDFDHTINTALTVSIQQSKYVNVFPNSRIKETLKLMQKKELDKLSEELGREVAIREGIKAIVVPSISSIGDSYYLTAKIVEPREHLTLTMEMIQVSGKPNIVSSIGELAQKIRNTLGESLKSIQKENVSLPKATTFSLKALKYYTEGLNAMGTANTDESIVFFNQAIDIDSNFALAHVRLGATYYWYKNNRMKGEEHFNKALNHLERLTEKEQLLIQAMIPAYRENRNLAAIKYNVYTRKYPDDSGGWNNLGHNYLMIKRWEDAIDAFQKSLKIYPNQANALINLATCYNALEDYRQAINYYQQAVNIQPNYLLISNINSEIGFAYVKIGNFQKAKEIFETMFTGDNSHKAIGHRHIALFNMYLGKYSTAINHLTDSIFLYKSLNWFLSEFRNRLFLIEIYLTQENTSALNSEISTIEEIYNNNTLDPLWLLYIGKFYSRLGLINKANIVLKYISDRLNESSRVDKSAFYLLQGEIELAKKNYLKALELFEMGNKVKEDNYSLESIAHCYYKSGNLDNALLKYKLLISRKQLGWEPQQYWIFAHYHLGKIYEEKGDMENAILYYKNFLDIWEEADRDLPIYIDAKGRLAKINKNKNG